MSAYRIGRKFTRGVLPSVFCDLPCWLRHKGWERKPVVVLVFLQVCIRDQQKLCEERGVSLLQGVFPDLTRVNKLS
jgi:hypothetical protein